MRYAQHPLTTGISIGLHLLDAQLTAKETIFEAIEGTGWADNEFDDYINSAIAEAQARATNQALAYFVHLTH